MSDSFLSKFLRYTFLVTLLFLIFSPIDLARAQDNPSSSILVSYTPLSGASLDDLLTGKTGDGLLSYSISDRGDLRLVVWLKNSNGANDNPVAEIFELPPALQHQATASITANILDGLIPKVILRSLDSKWLINGHPSYNLDISLYGPSYSMWGSGYDPNQGFQSWAAKISPDTLAVKIQVRDTNADGLPDWDLRQLVPDFPGQGYLRTNYTERKCDTPTIVNKGVFPAWPYIASSGGFEQAPGQFRPPIVVDWQTGKIIYFSELVSARNQNCSYTIYSIIPLKEGQYNILNFEAPFAFYDLSGQGNGYPNLVIRTERHPANDPWMSETNEQFELIRYSWRDTIGDGLWDYKIEVLGFHPYTFTTRIAGSEFLIDVPDYSEFPNWVIQNSWPLVTFIDTEGNSYNSSEGNYEWSPRSFGAAYFTGNIDKPNLDAFQTINEGFRGEYRVNKDDPPILYFSQVDGRLHLKGAEAGIYNIGGSQIIGSYNLDGDDYIDGWTREEVSPEASTDSKVVEGLFKLDNRYIYFNDHQVKIFSSTVSDSQFELIPPTDSSSWEVFRRTLEKNASDRKDPTSLLSWMDGVEDELLNISNATISLPRYDYGIYRFQLFVSNGFQLTGQNEIGMDGISPGKYLVSYDTKTFQVVPLTPPHLSLDITPHQIDKQITDNLLQVDITASNSGSQDSLDQELVIRADCANNTQELLKQPVDIYGMSTVKLSVIWIKPEGKECQLSAALFDENENQVTRNNYYLPAITSSVSLSLKVINTSTQGLQDFPAFESLALLGLIAALLLWSFIRLNNQTREK
jgi:hypothetical protein